MIVTNMRYGFTKNLGNYESCKVEIEGIPNDGQTADEVMVELKAYVSAQLPGPANGAPTEPVTEAKPRVPRVKKANATKAPETIAEAVDRVATLAGQQLAVFYNACRDDNTLALSDDFPLLSKAVSERCQQTCEIGSAERAAISAALKSEKNRREN
jgi:hypothetical protein